MNIVHAQYNNIKLIGGFQFWSNPKHAETDKAIPVVLSRPTLIDLVGLVKKYGTARIAQANHELFQSGTLSTLIYERNVRQLGAIDKARA